MKLSFLLIFLPLAGFAQALSGTYVIGASQPAPFNTLTNAINRLNASGVSAPTVFLLDNELYNSQSGEVFPLTIKPFTGSSTVNTLTIRPNTGRNVVISATGPNGYTGTPAAIVIKGADNIIINGSNTINGTDKNLTITNNDNIGYLNRTALWIASDSNNGVVGVTVSNTKIKMTNRNQEQMFFTGILASAYSLGSNNDLIVTNASAANSTLVFNNNEFVNVRQAVWVSGGSSLSTNTSNLTISSNVMGSTTDAQKPSMALYIANADTFNVTDNTIIGVLNANYSNPTIAAMVIESSGHFIVKRNIIRDVKLTTNHIIQYALLVKGNSTNGIVSENKITDVKNTGNGIVRTLCVDLSGVTASNIVVANNFITDVTTNGTTTNAAHGIFLQGGNGTKVYYNTVVMNLNQNNISAALYINGGNQLDVRNNIFANTGTQGTRYAIYSNVPASAFTYIDNNDYYAQYTGYMNNSQETLAQWRAASGKDSASIRVLPTFTADRFHLDAAANLSINNTGTPLTEVLSDIDGQTRSATTPDIGADEFDLPLCTTSTIWNGTSWSNGLPGADTSAIFTGNYTAASNLTACAMKVSNNAVVRIPAGLTVNLNSSLTVDPGASFKLDNNANLLQPSDALNTGAISMKITTAALLRQDYVMWSSPVAGQNLLAFSPATLTNRFYGYNSTSDIYVAVASPSTTTFTAAQSYLIRLPNTHPATPTAWTGEFTGTPNNGSVSVAVTPGTYNAVGNPYPSTINADEFIKQNNLNAPLYFYRKTNGAPTSAYATYNLAGSTATGSSGIQNPAVGQQLKPTNIIAAGQGFIAKATSTSLNFNNTMRTGTAGQMLRMNNAGDRNRLWLNLTTTDGMFSQALVAYLEDATNDVDSNLDGLYINDSETALTSLIDNDEYSIQSRSLPFDPSDIVRLGFKTAVAGTFTISIDHIEGLFANGQTIFLKDNTTGTLHNLESGYTFTAEVGVFNSRFELVYQNSLGTVDVTPNEAISVIKQHGEIIINTVEAMDDVAVYDMSGRLIASQKKVDANTTRIATGNVTGLLLVQVKVGNRIEVKKVMN
ncbi:MAG: T9SS type A sorting domain-containing protein [Flavobacterium sp. JAD_PAG50586_2]|nr:MAG: T9SS type A sorting domain-containing protein [Flavobacterium sp. JAD_PAG50586_2]